MTLNSYIASSEFFASLQQGERVCLLVRHGERGHILPDDPNHGSLVGLTDKGRKQAYDLGNVIGAMVRPTLKMQDVAFYSSPVGRCMQTAEFIGRGIFSGLPCEDGGLPVPKINPLQPLAEFFVEHYDAYMETHATGFYQGICRWLDGSANIPGYHDPAYFPLAGRSNEMLQFMLERCDAVINIFATHDAWIVPCLNYFCGLKFSPNLWMNFLTGMAVVVAPDAKRSLQVRRIVAVTGIDDGNLVFG